MLINNSENVKACKIAGNYDDYIIMMGSKLDRKTKLDTTIATTSTKLIDSNSDIIVIDSFDGAQHTGGLQKIELILFLSLHK